MSRFLQYFQSKMQTLLHYIQSLLSKCSNSPIQHFPLLLMGTLESNRIDFKLYIFWNLSVYGNAIESMSGTNSGKEMLNS